MTLSLLVFVTIATALFLTMFGPLLAEAWRQEAEHWKSRNPQLVAIPISDDRRW